MKKIRNIIFFVILSFLVISCSRPYSQVIKIKKCKTKQTIILKKKPSQGNIVGIKISITGNISGEAKIALILNNKEYKMNKIKDIFSVDWGGDWYSNTATVIYEPIGVENGNICLNYNFIEI